jgi:hypothetical protein
VFSQPKGSEKITNENSTNTIHDVWSRNGAERGDKQDNDSAKDQRVRQHLKGGIPISFEPQQQQRSLALPSAW